MEELLQFGNEFFLKVNEKTITGLQDTVQQC